VQPPEYIQNGHVSEKTDAFALGIVIIELLISGSIDAVSAADFPIKARALVNEEDSDELAKVVEGMAAGSGWSNDGAKHAAKILTKVAVSLTRPYTKKRQAPAQVMAQLETAYGGRVQNLVLR
jgi:hypothetical protein